MVLGMTAFTFAHVIISLVAIGSGVIAVYGMLASRRFDSWTSLFLATTLATSVTGFFFPFHGFTPAIGVGILSTILLVTAIAARYAFQLGGSWRWIYVVSAVAALYFNVFVLIAQSFQKLPVLKALAPTQSEAPFVVAQALGLLLFLAIGLVALGRFHPSA